ncbi:hypothetical protein [Cereibacter changlensis]|uniref:hypothetical protein n=1 Tax=Cereibacter changlensis TaxID=402884 RepID=UPI004034881B
MTAERRDQLLSEIYAARLAAQVRSERLRHEAHIGKPTQAGHKGGTGPSANSVKLLLAVFQAGRDGFASTSAAFEAAGLKGNGKKAETLRVENRGLITVDRERPAPNMPHILRLTAAGKAELKSRGLIK